MTEKRTVVEVFYKDCTSWVQVWNLVEQEAIDEPLIVAYKMSDGEVIEKVNIILK
jgi:hypothetical protein